jgi:HEAT repeat protein
MTGNEDETRTPEPEAGEGLPRDGGADAEAETEVAVGGPSILGLFLVPLMIVLVAMALVAAVYLLSVDSPTAEEYARQLRSPDKAERWQAALSLLDTQRGSPDLVPILIEMAEATREDQNLVRTNWNVSDLIRTPEEREVNLRWYATAALGAIGGEQAERKLKELLRDEDGGVRLYAAHSLGRIGKPEFMPLLTDRLLNDSDAGVRAVAAYTLGELGDTGARAALAQAHEKDPEIDVRWNSAIALARMGDAAVRPTLEEMMRSDNAHVRTQARRALRTLGSGDAAGG